MSYEKQNFASGQGTDLSGNKIPIAGAVYAGAVEAGYTGTPDEFGAALAALLTSKT